MPGIVWPQIRQAAVSVAGLLKQLEKLERLSTEKIASGQQQQILALHAWHAERSPFYRQRLLSAGLDPRQAMTLDGLRQIKPLTRRELQGAGQKLFCAPPPAHLPISETRTSGSSGEPVVVQRTAVNQLFWLANTMREHVWWKRDLSGTLAIVRANLQQDRISGPNWGPPASLFARTGPVHAFSTKIDSQTQLEWLSRVNPHYLLIYPTTLADLLRHFERLGRKLSRLQQIRSIGESLSDALREETRRILGVEIVDTYSSQELGVIAIQCPASGLYHLMAENLFVEVLNEQGQACGPGETGEVVVTDLHNFATSLIRYAIGDMAEVGPACSCGKGLPTLRRVLGRSRNLAVYPDGTRRWPRPGFDRYREVAPVIQYQLVQRSLTGIEVRLVVERPLSVVEEAALAAIIQAALGHPFDLSFTYFDDKIPRGPGGKFEEFVCEVS